MAVAILSSAASPLLRTVSDHPWRLLPRSSLSPPFYSSSSSLANPRVVHLHHNNQLSPRFLRAAQSPVPEPPPPEDPIAGLQVVLSRIQDRIRIFFAVFFWLSLFFWGSVWDGRGNSRKKKGPWSRK